MTTKELELLTPNGFDSCYFRHLADSTTCKEAYEKTEAEYKAVFRKNRYSGYESYRVIRNKRLKKT
jgi:hypothetical protein